MIDVVCDTFFVGRFVELLNKRCLLILNDYRYNAISTCYPITCVGSGGVASALVSLYGRVKYDPFPRFCIIVMILKKHLD